MLIAPNKREDYDPFDDGVDEYDDAYWEALRLEAEEREAWEQMPLDDGGFDDVD